MRIKIWEIETQLQPVVREHWNVSRKPSELTAHDTAHKTHTNESSSKVVHRILARKTFQTKQKKRAEKRDSGKSCVKPAGQTVGIELNCASKVSSTAGPVAPEPPDNRVFAAAMHGKLYSRKQGHTEPVQLL